MSLMKETNHPTRTANRIKIIHDLYKYYRYFHLIKVSIYGGRTQVISTHIEHLIFFLRK